MSEQVSAAICTYNEEANIEACIASVSCCDEVIVADDGSTDRTVELAKAAGARVFRRKDWSEPVPKGLVTDFRKRFGWAPSFRCGQRIRNGHLESLERVHACSHDWVIVPDADERCSFPTGFDSLRELLPVASQISCEFAHSHDQFGNPERMTRITKMFRQSKTDISGRVHTVIVPAEPILETNLMRVDHWQRPGHSQDGVLSILEYCVAKDDDSRSRFYLGREYFYHERFEHALAMLNHYLIDANWQPEIAKARQYEAMTLWRLGRGDEAREAAMKALLLNPDDQHSLMLMSEFYYSPWKEKWARLASHATNEGVLF